MFTDQAVKAKYNCLTEKDRKVHIAGVYSGLLSNITEVAAARMIKSNSNLISEAGTKPSSDDKKADVVKEPAKKAKADPQ